MLLNRYFFLGIVTTITTLQSSENCITKEEKSFAKENTLKESKSYKINKNFSEFYNNTSHTKCNVKKNLKKVAIPLHFQDDKAFALFQWDESNVNQESQKELEEFEKKLKKTSDSEKITLNTDAFFALSKVLKTKLEKKLTQPLIKKKPQKTKVKAKEKTKKNKSKNQNTEVILLEKLIYANQKIEEISLENKNCINNFLTGKASDLTLKRVEDDTIVVAAMQAVETTATTIFNEAIKKHDFITAATLLNKIHSMITQEIFDKKNTTTLTNRYVKLNNILTIRHTSSISYYYNKLVLYENRTMEKGAKEEILSLVDKINSTQAKNEHEIKKKIAVKKTFQEAMQANEMVSEFCNELGLNRKNAIISRVTDWAN